MTKRLVLCCDGTWNTPDQTHPTNVTKLALAVAPRAGDVEQLAYYQRGVGTSRRERLRGGVFGWGLSRGVKDVYDFVVTHYEPGDEIFLFGYSRGAYTARSVAGLIRNAGILRPENAARIDQAYALYREKSVAPRDTASELFRRSFSHPDVRIRFVGVWDTVGALGIPVGANPIVGLVNRRWRFHDVRLSRSVDAAYHALAIDEKRRPFTPTLWRQNPDPQGQTLEQVWFAGCHSDVGGGSADTGLSDIALQWMVDKARSCGLVLAQDVFDADGVVATASAGFAPDLMGKIHESRTGLARLLPRLNRPIGAQAAGNESVSPTARERRSRIASYRPPNLESYLRAHRD